jgi:hypothetical protein
MVDAWARGMPASNRGFNFVWMTIQPCLGYHGGEAEGLKLHVLRGANLHPVIDSGWVMSQAGNGSIQGETPWQFGLDALVECMTRTLNCTGWRVQAEEHTTGLDQR